VFLASRTMRSYKKTEDQMLILEFMKRK